jgi:hypothetical protein
VPGTETTTNPQASATLGPASPAHEADVVVPSGPNRVLSALPSRTASSFLHNPEGLRVLDIHDRCRFALTSVSASEHPDPSDADRGLLAGVHRRGAP